MALFSTLEKLEILITSGTLSDKDREIFEQYLNESVNGLGATEEIIAAVNQRYDAWLDNV